MSHQRKDLYPGSRTEYNNPDSNIIKELSIQNTFFFMFNKRNNSWQVGKFVIMIPRVVQSCVCVFDNNTYNYFI